LLKIYAGGLFFSDEVAAEMMKNITNHQTNDENKAHLTERKLEVVKLIAEDYNNAKIAELLFISERTVETHRKIYLEKRTLI
jgi:two-component system nitrate/nitrite response regulator NarL